MKPDDPKQKDVPTIAMLGSLPPLRALSSYCLEFSMAMADHACVSFLSFRKIYPAFLYPGGTLQEDHTFPEIVHERLRIRRFLTWYNPLTWLIEGFFTKAELLHAQWWSLPLFMIYACICLGFRLRKKPVVFTVHNVLSHERSRLFTLASGWLFRLGDHFLVHSPKNKQQLIRQYGISPKQITVIPHGPLDFHVSSKLSRQEARAKLNIKPEEKMILLFGAIRPYKGIDTAIAAFGRVLKEIPDARLVIAGKLWEDWIPYKNKIKNLNLEKHIDTFLNYIPAEMVSVFFTAADLVLLPYHHFDSQSGVGAIAVSFRKPLIVSTVGGLPELVNDPRCIVPPKDDEALAKAIVSTLMDPDRLKTMGNDAKAVAEKISWPAIAKKVLSVYKNLLRNSSDKHM
ncbi:MAG: glycosyl transferase family 1 [Desulfobacterium sp.]|nr:glycosyl transferase family 1 [Desulfobacterium sp.]